MKTLKILLCAGMLASTALCAVAKTPAELAKEVASKHFELNKEATALQLKINEICKQKRQIMFDATQSLAPEDKKAFNDEMIYQKRQNLASLKRGEAYIEGICGMPLKDRYAPRGPRGPRPDMPCAGANCPLR